MSTSLLNYTHGISGF